MENLNFRFRTIGEILRERGLVSEEQLERGLEEQRLSGKLLGEILIEHGYLKEADLLRALGIQAGMEPIALGKVDISQAVLEKVPGSLARLYNIIPLSFERGILTVATSEPLNLSIFDDLRFMLNCEVKGKITTIEEINQAIQKYYGRDSASVDEIFAEISGAAGMEKGVLAADDEGQLPIVKLINMILLKAISKQASDIHFEPFQKKFKIRYRVDGVLYDIANPPLELHQAIASRIKIMANLNIAETRLPQDGRTFVKIQGGLVDLRISCLPTIFGESIVIRVLDREAVRLSLDELGLEEATRKKLRGIIRKPFGIVLSTGPTGCGKTTSQYSCLNEINREEVKIITVEDPVEFDLAGLIQVSVRPKINLTFPLVLRHILRQDPDIVMVGEIRDTETVHMAIHASLTGHLVFSTLHTNDAPSAVTRLMDMGVEAFLIASSLEAVLAQRLLRKVCDRCRQEYPADEKERELLGADPQEEIMLVRGKGCEACGYTGYRNRVGIFELLIFDEDLRSLVLDRASVEKIREQAILNGMKTLREDAICKVRQGLTTVEELLHLTTLEV